MVYDVFVPETGEIIVGGLIGAASADAVIGTVSGAAGLTGSTRAVANLVGKVIWGLSFMGLAAWVDHDIASPILEGMGVIPICTIPNDIVMNAKGRGIQDEAYAWALSWRAKAAAGRAAGVGPVHAPSRGLLAATVPTVAFRGGR